MVSSPVFVRDRVTWLAYWMLSYGAYAMGLLGPLMPFLRDERRLSFTLGGVLTAAVAVGTIASGLLCDRVVSRWGRRRVLWAAAAGVALAAIGVAVSVSFPLLFACALFMGAGCSMTITTVQAALSDRHGERRGVAFTESNVVAALITSLGPLTVGGLQRLGAGWHWALVLPAAGLLLLAALYRHDRLPESAVRTVGARTGSSALPAGFWAFWVVVVLVVSIEWCLVVWGADYLETVIGLSKVNAATAMGVFFVAIVVGRFVGSRLARRLPGATLLLLALAVTAAGFPLFWLPRWPAANLVGLFVTGLGVASLFPFTLSVALSLTPQHANLGSARVSLGVGVAIFAAPLVLGWSADNLGLPVAFALVAVLIVAAMAVTFAVRRVTAAPAAAVPV
jgi:MFS family permease